MRLRTWALGIVRRVYGWLLPMNPADGQGFVVEPDGGVVDGVDYSRPAVLPGWLRREMRHDDGVRRAVLESLQESVPARYRSQFGDPYTQTNLPFSPVTEDPLMEWDHGTRERVLSNCHAAYSRNPLANSIVQFTTQFVVGDGFNVDYKNAAVEAIVEAFIANPDNAIREYERQALNDLQVDGELFLQMYSEGGETVVVPRRPWECRGIKTEAGFFRRVEAYLFQRLETEGDSPTSQQQTVEDDVAANDMLYVAINRHAYELRGRPELYRLLPWLQAHTEMLSDRVRQAKWRNALLWVVNVKSQSAATMAAVAQRWRKPPNPGSVAVESDAVTVTAATNSSNAADAINDIRVVLLMNVLGARLPEYFFGNGKETNLATATKQELPALTKFETFQQIMLRQVWTPLIRRVIQNAVDGGLLADKVAVEDADGDPLGEMVKAIDAFNVTYEPVTQQDIWAMTQALEKQKANGWISDKTAQEMAGLDPHMEAKRLSQQREDAMAAMAQGLMPVPPGMLGRGLPASVDEDDSEDQQGGEQKPGSDQS